MILKEILIVNGSKIKDDAKKNNGIKSQWQPSYDWRYLFPQSVMPFNANDELNITGTTMTIEVEEDVVKVDNDDNSAGTMHLSR